jgi:hypothetical protein
VGLSGTATAQNIGLYGGKDYQDDKDRLDKEYVKLKKSYANALAQAKDTLYQRRANCKRQSCREAAQKIYDGQVQYITEMEMENCEDLYTDALTELINYWKKGKPSLKPPPKLRDRPIILP